MIEYYAIVTRLLRHSLICEGKTHIQSKVKISLNEGMFTLNFDNMTNEMIIITWYINRVIIVYLLSCYIVLCIIYCSVNFRYEYIHEIQDNF